MWPVGDVAAPVHVWETPSECAGLLRHTLHSWGFGLSRAAAPQTQM